MPPMPNETMDEGTPPMPSEPDGDETMGENVICVPTDALALPDEKDAMTPPAPGDKVQASIEGEVVSVNGKDAYVKLSAVNGQEIKDDAEEQDPEAQDAAEESSLQGQAASMPPLQ